jgi:hypothetical protein
MVANFSDEHTVLPKATVLGIAEISESLVASINDENELGGRSKQRSQDQLNSPTENSKFKLIIIVIISSYGLGLVTCSNSELPLKL